LGIGWVGGIADNFAGESFFCFKKDRGIFGSCFWLRKKTGIMGGLQAENKRFFRWIPLNIVVTGVTKLI
jgi:hypothetical protein